ncbi:fumarylacetoacetate hydrolase family protein [Nocardia sp. NPDC003693]
MTTSVLRTADGWWVCAPDGETAYPVDTAATTTAELLADRTAVDAAHRADPATGVRTADLALLSPVTAPCRVVAQMTNYVSHVRDSGMDPARVPLTFFRKSSHSITGPRAEVVRPAHVTLLDYEIEIGLVMGAALPVGTELRDGDLGTYVAGLVLANDISARDIQLPKTQFYEGKSYPTFTPLGPRLVLLDAGELARFEDLRLTLRVNGVVRQDATVRGDIIYPPLRALRELNRFQPLDPGDVLLTGTPAGTALVAPPKPIELLGALLPAHLKWKSFFRRQAANPKFLREGDVMELTAATPDGAVDLGTQRTVVRFAR